MLECEIRLRLKMAIHPYVDLKKFHAKINQIKKSFYKPPFWV